MLEENRAATAEVVRAHGRRCRARLGRRLRPLLLLRRAAASSSRATTWWGCWPRRSCGSEPRRAHRARPAPHLEHARHRAAATAARRCCASPAMPSSSRRCARWTRAYGGEMSAHHYFRKFSYCDSGMIPWLLVLGRSSASAASRCRRWSASACGCFPPAARSTAICRRDAKSILARVQAALRAAGAARSISPTACRWSSTHWRFNLRGSNTEPLVRLNVESRGDEALMREKTAEVLKLLDA